MGLCSIQTTSSYHKQTKTFIEIILKLSNYGFWFGAGRHQGQVNKIHDCAMAHLVSSFWLVLWYFYYLKIIYTLIQYLSVMVTFFSITYRLLFLFCYIVLFNFIFIETKKCFLCMRIYAGVYLNVHLLIERLKYYNLFLLHCLIIIFI